MFQNLIKKLDLFGVPVGIYHNRDYQQETMLGAITTIILFILGFAYSLQIWLMWYQNKFLPTIQTKQEQVDETFEIKFDLFQIQVVPFLPITKYNQSYNKNFQGYVFDPIAFDYQRNSIGKNYHLGFQQALGSQIIDLNRISPLKLGMTHKEGQKCLLMSLLKCDSTDSNITCSNSTSPYLSFVLNITMQQYDDSKDEIQEFTRTYVFVSSFQSTLFMKVIPKLSNIYITDGSLYPRTKLIEIVSDVDVMVNNVQIDNYTQRENQVGNLRAIIQLNEQKTIVRITHYNVAQIFAQIGSVFSILTLFGQLTQYIGRQRFKGKLIFEVMKIYFPELRNKNANINFWGKITDIGEVKPEKVGYQELQHNLILAEQQLDILNILKQLQILQRSIKNIYPRPFFHLLFKQGDRLPIDSQEKNFKFYYNLEGSEYEESEGKQEKTLLQEFNQSKEQVKLNICQQNKNPQLYLDLEQINSTIFESWEA